MKSLRINSCYKTLIYNLFHYVFLIFSGHYCNDFPKKSCTYQTSKVLLQSEISFSEFADSRIVKWRQLYYLEYGGTTNLD